MSEAAAIGQDGVVTEATVSPMDHYGDLYRYAYARLGSVEDAEDLAIEVIERASRRKGRCTDRLLLLHAARNKVIDRLRKRSRRDKKLPSPSPVRIDGDIVLQVNLALAELSAEQSDLLVFKYVHGLTAREIAEILETTESAVASALARARANFRKTAAPLFDYQESENERD